ncbi:aldehyde dehydrogenase [Vagococcus sp. JNUCC 83]
MNRTIPSTHTLQREFFYSQQTKELSFRLEQLEKLRLGIISYEQEIIEALRKDLGKHPLETYATEIGFVLNSIRMTQKSLKKWMKDEKRRTPLFLQPSKSRVISEPYGVVLIIGPFNYPFQLLIEPLVGAIAAGNTAILKPSELVPTFSKVIEKMIHQLFSSSYVDIFLGEKDTTIELLKQPFDYIFFTGSTSVGKSVMKAASEHLTPVTLELGGKSPTIITSKADIPLAARRVIYGKMMNAGQTCVAPDYVVVEQSVKEEFISQCQKTLLRFYGEDIKQSSSFSRIVNERHTKRLVTLMEQSRDELIVGGTYDISSCYVEPTLYAASWESPLMKDEIFGPLLPIISYQSLDDVINHINDRPKPLALYIFSRDKSEQDKILHQTSSGGVSINNTIFHLVSGHLPFGGVGESGIGNYHGKYSFDTFSHKRAVLTSKKIDTPFIYPPYTDKHLKWIKRVLK